MSRPVPTTGRRVLVLGGARSGKSAAAERMLADEPAVVYAATAPARPDDAEWVERVRRHRARRPARWSTVEGADLAALLGGAGPAVLIDSITAWLTAVLDGLGAWAAWEPTGTDDDPAAGSAPRVPGKGVEGALADRIEALVRAWSAPARPVVAVSDEVGGGIVPASPGARRFRDELGELNQRLAAAADEVWLVTAGIAQRLK